MEDPWRGLAEQKRAYSPGGVRLLSRRRTSAMAVRLSAATRGTARAECMACNRYQQEATDEARCGIRDGSAGSAPWPQAPSAASPSFWFRVPSSKFVFHSENL